MAQKRQSLIKREFDGLKDMAMDLVPRLIGSMSAWQSPEQFFASMGSVAAGFAAGRAKKLLEELRDDEENIDEKELSSEKASQSFIELMKFAAQENPDVETWEAVKKIFKHSLRKDVTEQERLSLYDMLDICKQLNGSEIRILAGAYQILNAPEEVNKNQRQSDWWAGKVAENIGFAAKEQVLRFEDNLIRLQLIAPREILNGSTLDTWRGGGGTSEHRLTPLGRGLAKLLSE
ncbi:MAG: hypothetical protein Q8R25_02760 [bacterium]|nr:hypothetical protein [bacterium]